MELERKFLIPSLPQDLEQYPSCHIMQGYLCTNPVIRIRKQDEDYILTYMGSGLMSREEYNLPLNAQAFRSLATKIEGKMIDKTRYRIPYGPYTIELDIFHGSLAPLMLAEVEFPSEAEANAFLPPAWFGEDVTFSGKYHNSYLSQA